MEPVLSPYPFWETFVAFFFVAAVAFFTVAVFVAAAFFILAVFVAAVFFTGAGFVAAKAFLTLGAFFVVVFEVGDPTRGESLISMSKIAPSSDVSIVEAPRLARVGAAGIAC